MQNKKEIRQQILKLRREMAKDEIISLSNKISDTVFCLSQYQEATHICFYMPINNEVDLVGLMTKSIDIGKNVYLPRVYGESMEFYRYSKDTELITGSFNILEPDCGEKLIPNNKTMVIMPGAVFSTNMDRIGYGGGFYDRYLSKYPQIFRLAVCYDFQILDEIPHEEFDIHPHMIISEARIIKN